MTFDKQVSLETSQGWRSLEETAKRVQPVSKAVISSDLANNPVTEVTVVEAERCAIRGRPQSRE